MGQEHWLDCNNDSSGNEQSSEYKIMKNREEGQGQFLRESIFSKQKGRGDK